jgi:hypothetical protein
MPHVSLNASCQQVNSTGYTSTLLPQLLTTLCPHSPPLNVCRSPCGLLRLTRRRKDTSSDNTPTNLPSHQHRLHQRNSSDDRGHLERLNLLALREGKRSKRAHQVSVQDVWDRGLNCVNVECSRTAAISSDFSSGRHSDLCICARRQQEHAFRPCTSFFSTA